MKIKRIILASIVLMLFACKSRTNVNKEVNSAKNVILLISDGTGLSQVSSAFYFKESSPNYSRFKNIGLIKTSSSREDVTDSAAGATAFACGVKTYNGAIGVTDDSTEVKNLVEIASLKNINTGMIATSSITHATPASFYAHTLNRGSAEKIALHLVQSEIDFFAGGRPQSLVFLPHFFSSLNGVFAAPRFRPLFHLRPLPSFFLAVFPEPSCFLHY